MLVSCTHVCTDIFIMEIKLNIRDSIHFLKFTLIRYVKSHRTAFIITCICTINYIIKYALY